MQLSMTLQILIKTKIRSALAFKLSDVVFFLLIIVKMPTFVGIFTFMSRINFIHSRVEHDKKVLEPWGETFRGSLLALILHLISFIVYPFKPRSVLLSCQPRVTVTPCFIYFRSLLTHLSIDWFYCPASKK